MLPPRRLPDEIRAALHLSERPRLILASDEFDTWAVGASAVVKVARSPEDGAKLVAEFRIHDLLRGTLGSLIPRIVDHGNAEEAWFTVYEFAKGRQGQIEDGVTVEPRAMLAQDVGQVFARLHALTRTDVQPYGVAHRDVTLAAGRLGEQTVEACGAIVGRPRIDRFLGDPPPRPSSRESFCHADLKGEHLFVDQRAERLTAIIDWADAAICDPAQDYAGLVIWLGSAFTRAAVDASGEDDGTLADRAVWLGRYGLLDYWDAVLDGRESAPIPLITQQLRIAFSD